MLSNHIQESLIENHNKYFRDFPWRHKKSSYEIMIAEFMLHRTKADQVVPVYVQFLKNYPNIKSLCSISYEEISNVTKHLGLHWRSNHFIDSAKYINSNFNGEIPKSRKELLQIPGIGDYVSGAILAVCYNKREHVIDSNIARLINRFFDLQLTGEIRRKKIIKEKAIELFDFSNTRQLLFSILDFTALICKPTNPKCNECVLSKDCEYRMKPRITIG